MNFSVGDKVVDSMNKKIGIIVSHDGFSSCCSMYAVAFAFGSYSLQEHELTLLNLKENKDYITEGMIVAWGGHYENEGIVMKVVHSLNDTFLEVKGDSGFFHVLSCSDVIEVVKLEEVAENDTLKGKDGQLGWKDGQLGWNSSVSAIIEVKPDWFRELM